jgi:hypothetical protein
MMKHTGLSFECLPEDELAPLGHLYIDFPPVERDIEQDVALLEAAIAEWLAETVPDDEQPLLPGLA